MPLPLFDYQAQAADVLATRDRLGLHDEMGIGKTATTIGAIDRIGATRGVVIAPAMLRENWLREFRRFSQYERRICKGRTIHDYIAWSRKRFDILVTSYEQATKWSGPFMENCEFCDFMVMDEAHYLKNPESNRTRAILGRDAGSNGAMTTFADYAWHVTGTPMSNDPMDVYTFLRFAKAINMEADDFANLFFERRATTFGARHSVKPDMLATLQELIRNNSIRRTHSQVGMELPPIFLNELLLEGRTVEIDKLLEAYPTAERVLIDAIQTGNLEHLDAPYVAILRRLMGKAKAVPYAELLRRELDAEPTKRVVFAWHTEPLLHVAKYLRKHGYGVSVAYGGTNERDRVEAVRSFMEDDDVHVFIGNIRVAGVGLTLTESSQIDMLESDWSPAGNAQAIKRVHRYGQQNNVHARFITLANSIDVGVNRTVAHKTAAIAEVEGHAMTAAPLDAYT